MGRYSKFEDYADIKLSEHNVLEHDFDIMDGLFCLESKSRNETQVSEFIINLLTKWKDEDPSISFNKDTKGNILATKGTSDNFPCIVGHIDTVHSITGNKHYIRTDSALTAINTANGSRIGVGGDDFCGVYVALNLFNTLKEAKVAFFVEEEIGCIGSGEIDMKFFDDCAFVLQTDRNGDGEWLTYSNGTDLASEEFTKKVESIGYKYTRGRGTATDTGKLKNRGLKVCCCNVSSGYFDAHSDRETVALNSLLNTMNLMYHVCTTMSDKKWLHTKPEPTTKTWGSHRTYPRVTHDYDAEEAWENERNYYNNYKQNKPTRTKKKKVEEKLTCPSCNKKSLELQPAWGGFCGKCYTTYTNKELKKLKLVAVK